jgi:probable phosphoglycerate mutase
VSEQTQVYRQLRFRRPPGATEILLVRHGESAPANPSEPFPMVEGHSDPPLDPVGHRQAQQVAARILASGEHVAAIYVTTLQRTHQTAAPLARALEIEPQVERDLREVNLGEWEGGGLFRKHVSEGHPVALEMASTGRWDVIPGAEKSEALEARVRSGIRRIAERHPDQTVVVVAHGGVIGQVLAIATGGRSFAFSGADNASISHLVIAGERWIVRRFNDTGHLTSMFTEFAEPPA